MTHYNIKKRMRDLFVDGHDAEESLTKKNIEIKKNKNYRAKK